jgi:hypothetical protein
MVRSNTTLVDALTGMLPDGVTAAANPWYLRLRSKKADRRHRPVAEEPRDDTQFRHVLVLVVDALRLDATPDLPFAWSAGVAPSTWTFPSVTSMHTGRYPHEHGSVARTNAGDEAYAMPEQTTNPVLPYAFERAGFETFAGIAFLTPFLAIRRWYQRHRVFPDVRADRVLERYRSWRDGRDRTFAYLHLGDLHAPLDPPAEYVAEYDVDTSLPNLDRLAEYTDSYDGSDDCRYYRDQRLALYRATLAYLEDQIEQYVLPVCDDTLVLLAGDHGEAHWEHVDVDRRMTDSRPNYGVGHGGTPLDPVARVPVALSTPGGDVSICGGAPSLCDVPKTLLNLTFPSMDTDIPGENWMNRIPRDRVAVCEGPRYGVERKAAYRGREKVIESREDDVVLGATVAESEPGDRFGALDPETVKALRDRFVWTDRQRSADTSRYVQEQLEALGYK